MADTNEREFPTFPPEVEARMRAILAPLQSVVPTEPGEYIDRTGDPWTLNEDGTWTDHTGMTRGTEDNWILAWNLPLTPSSLWDTLL